MRSRTNQDLLEEAPHMRVLVGMMMAALGLILGACAQGSGQGSSVVPTVAGGVATSSVTPQATAPLTSTRPLTQTLQEMQRDMQQLRLHVPQMDPARRQRLWEQTTVLTQQMGSLMDQMHPTMQRMT